MLVHRAINKGKLRSNKAVKSSRLYTEHTNSYHKIQTRTFQVINVDDITQSKTLEQEEEVGAVELVN